MSHLSPDEFVDAAAGALDSTRTAHLEACAACRGQAAEVASALSAVRDVGMPEPSPLYWGHLSARIREAVSRETIVPAWRAVWLHPFRPQHLVPVASAVALAGAVVVSGLMLREGRVAIPMDRAVETAAVADASMPDDSEAWRLLTSAAAETPIEDAHAAGMAVPASAIDGAVQRMTPDELHALEELLQRELRGSGE